MFKLLYRKGKVGKEFSKLELVNISGNEKKVSEFFEKNLGNIFPELELFIFKKNSKETTEYYLKGAKKTLDAICWYPKGQFFIILEYKSKKPHEIMRQIREYLGAISSRKCHDLFDELNIQFPKDKKSLWKYGDIKWNKTKLIWISPELPKEDWDDWYYEFDDIIWVESEWYKNNDEEAIVLRSNDKEKILENLSKKKKIDTIETLPQLLQKIKGIDKKVKEWSEKIDKSFVKKFSLTFKLYYYPDWWYNGVIFYYINGKRIFWLKISKKKFKVHSPKINKEGKEIKDKNSFSESLQIIREILAKQKRNNE